jgi:hypothetical protein
LLLQVLPQNKIKLIRVRKNYRNSLILFGPRTPGHFKEQAIVHMQQVVQDCKKCSKKVVGMDDQINERLLD